MRSAHNKATTVRPIRGRQRLFLRFAEVSGIAILLLIAIGIALARCAD